MDEKHKIFRLKEYLVSTLMSLGLEAVYEQGSHGKGNSYPHHTCPPVMLPRQTGNECTGRTTQKVNGHINGIDTIDGRCVKGDYAGLIRQMDALHTGINQQDSNYYPQIAVIPPKCQYPCSQHYASSGNREEPRTVLLDVAADENHRGCTCQSTQTECSDNVVASKKKVPVSSEKQGNSTKRRTSHKPMPPSAMR